MNATATIIVLGLGFMWLIQFGLTFWQLRRYNQRLSELRKQGTVWVGLHGSAWKGRTYAVIVVDKDKRVVCIEKFSGVTIFAVLKPIPGFEGRPLSDLTDDSVELPVSEKMLQAIRNAVQHMQDHEKRLAEKLNKEQENLSLDYVPAQNESI
jgi:DNA-binding transcriptional regulator of glucitol operon